MKFGFRIPSLKKRIAARTSWKRVVRHSIGLKAPRGLGWFTNPRKAAYNRIYNRTSFDIFKLLGRAFSGSTGKSSSTPSSALSLLFSAVFWLVLIIIGIGIAGSIFSTTPKPTASQPSSATSTISTPTSSAVAPASSRIPAASTSQLPPITQRFTTAEEAQRAAVRLYPDLGIAGSKLNSAFVARYKLYQQQRPDYFRDTSWPMRLAQEVIQTPQPK